MADEDIKAGIEAAAQESQALISQYERQQQQQYNEGGDKGGIRLTGPVGSRVGRHACRYEPCLKHAQTGKHAHRAHCCCYCTSLCLCVVVQVELSEGAAGGCERSDRREGSELARPGSHQRCKCHQRQRKIIRNSRQGRGCNEREAAALEIGRVTHSLRVCLGRAVLVVANSLAAGDQGG